ncbi:non-ribosomal peptide synthetase [Bacillus atrophaeus]|uniref:non-ribosomal peptide synthetase n=1 Tax=Bacillus atrophaeus TaxID=1452 RepID=UPI000D042F7D|nr:non-ribosomal peptide synthetase [Bacillus atrophaeus]PRR99354.1 non-ribosomal peptide synthetase [Bacillus atrophaeus]
MKRQSSKGPLSEGQKGLWMLQKMSPDMGAYNIPLCFRISKKLDIEKFKKALLFVQKQYPVLTSVIKEENGIPFQTAESSKTLHFEEADMSDMNSSDILPFIREKAKEPFELIKGPLMRTHLFHLSKDECMALITIHHVIFDGVSMLTFISTLLDAYSEFIQGREPALQVLSASYHDFVDWEKNMLDTREGAEHLAYWKEQLSGTLPVLELPADRPRSSAQKGKGQAYKSLLPHELGKQIKSFARSHHVNESVVFLALYKVLLHHYTNQKDIIVGMPTMGRPEDSFESIIGYFINMIAVRSKEIGTQTFTDFIRDLQLTVADGLDHAAYPFPALVRELHVDRAAAESPVFQAAFLYQNFFQTAGLNNMLEQYQTLGIEFVEELRQEGEFELALEVYEQGDETALHLLYNPDLFELSSIERMMGHYIKLAEEIIHDPSASLETYSNLLHQEQTNLLNQWNATETDDSKDKCIHEIFEEKAKKNPDAIAVIFEEETLTYQELDEKSTSVAVYLQEQGAGPESAVGICTERSLDMLVGILGILKAGGAYVPFDPNFPKERLEFMLKDSEVSIVLTQSKVYDKIEQVNVKNINIITIDSACENTNLTQQNRILKREVKPHHLAYILYTSGSTGKPKGVMVEHRSIMNTLNFLEAHYPVTAEDAYLLKTNYVFDVSISELFGWFIGNGRLIILPPGGEKSPQLCMDYIEKYQVTHINFAPAMLSVFLEIAADHKGFTENGPIKYMMVAGEAFPKELVKKAVAIFKNSSIENIYGPTEASIYAAYFGCTKEEISSHHTPIGKPVSNTRIYIVDQHLQPVPIGKPGELCIAGDGLARGYYNQPELTAETFIDNPFEPGTKLYKTGDSARWLSDGNIEYLGRIDSQVKIRGFRIELGAIESKLSEYPGILDQAVVVNQLEGHKRLAAYYTEQKSAVDPKELRRHLKSSLPEYMIPSHFIRLDEMPLTPSGKVNRKDLEHRKIVLERKKTNLLPLSEVEDKVHRIWEDILKVSGFGAEDGFFDVGGDSLLAVTAAERIKKELDCEFSVTELFEYSNIRAISQYIIESKKTDAVHSSIDKQQEMKRDEKQPEQQTLPPYAEDSVAIVGISCQFPGAKNHHDFWTNLKEGKESIQFFSKEELRTCGVPEELIQHPDYVPAQSAIEGKDLFDPGFFQMSPKDAEFMDPQLRLLLQHSWKAIEDAGYVSKEIPGTSVYMSASNNSYRSLLPAESTEGHGSPDGYVSWVLAQSGTIPTMISHKLGLKGPSYFVHANCSSSLVGLYQAYKSITSGEAKYALVGGATLHAQSGIGYVHQTGLNFSSDGHVKAFDASADGMAGGEGVAVVLLKKAADAVKDGDHIYALMRGIGLNNDGADKVGFYAPSVKGQTEVIQNVLDAANIHPETVSYIEAHGTGTKLGDPIEFSALNQVYKQYTDKKQFCGIGSVKTNIGHLDTAAGLAGCIKVAMSLYHNELAPSINYREPNPNINLDDSPFYVVKEGKSLEKKETVHRAALSSFGLGGTNAHAIFEQYASFSDVREESKGNSPYLIPVSAKNKERLQAYARELLAFINRKDQVHICLADVAYTYQIGREAMDSRVVFMASDVEEWKRQLENFIDGKPLTKGCFQGEKSRIKDAAPWLEDDETQELISSWISKGKQKKLAEMWAKGLHVEWQKLYPHAKPQRMSLPTYPFAEERYWPEISAADDKRSAGSSLLHPLVHHNTSVLSEQRFSSIFTGQEYFIAEHIIKGMAIVPAAVTLEMARAAVEQGLDDVKEQRTIRLKNVVWVRPVVAGHQPVKVNIGLYDEDDGQILYRMYGEPEDADTDPVLYSQGIAELCQTDHVTALDLAAIKNQCDQGSMDTALFYAGMIGADYGPGYKAVETVYMGQGQLLAKLSLPDSVSHTQDQYVLHPSVIDGALQAAEYLQNITRAGLSGSEEDFKAALPFALEELEVIHHCVPDMWVYVQFNEKNKPGDLIQKVDIHLCDEHGTVCVRIKGFSTRVMDGDAPSEAGSETLMLKPVWKEQNAAAGAQSHEYAEHLVFFCEYDQEIRDRIEGEMGHVRVFNLDGRPGSLDERFHSYTEQVFKKVQAIFHSKPQGNILIQIVTSSEGEQQLFSGMTGLLKTAELEHAKLTGQMIEISDKDGWESISDKLKENQTNRGAHIRYKNGKRYIADWNELEPANHEAGHPWKDDGVYLITGGAGGLGLIFAREIAEKTQHASFILTGRSPLGEYKKRKLEEIRNMGANISYKQTDVTDKIGVYQLINDIQQEYGRLNGILHSAGIIKDNYMIKKSAEELHAVLSPKVKGLVYLDEASKDMALDVFILFSSLSGSIGSIGQSDYAAANVFMDAYAGYRRTLADLGQRHGKTIAVNWPLWKEGGMNVDRETEERLVQMAGVVPLETEKGIGALYQALNSEMNRVMVIQGDLQKIKQKLLQKQAPATAEQKVTETVTEPIRRIDTGSLLDKVKAVLKQEVAKLLKVKIGDIDDYAEMTKYGFDSISMTEFTNHLNRNFKLELTPTIFFDHPTIHEFGKHLAQEYEAVFAEKFTVRAKTQSRIPAADKKEEHIQVTAKKRRTRQVILPETMQGESAPEPIAIVGISGIFPMAKDVDAYWHNLKEGKDCMTEIPKDRWDWREYQGDPAKEANKTNVKWGGFIDGIGEFDPLFFGISPREAEQMEPQQRLLLTYAWKAIEDAGYSAKSLSGTKTGVFIGTGNTGYGSLLSKANSAINGSAAANTSPSVGPNRVSYFLNLHGPSEPIDTACSSSLVAVHHAISSIEEGTCDMALAGGVNTIILPEVYISFDKAGALSKEGRCKTFSDQADGFAHGEGAGILFLKKLKAAEKAGDHIYGVIKGSAVNHGGRAASLTTPNPKAQAEVIQAAYKKAGIDPKTVTYIEAHGTGTELGDPVEINGLKAAFKALDINKGDSAVNSNYCGLGSAKTNIGHLSLAAGAAGIIKILLQLKHKTLVKSLHCEAINPYIQLKDSPFYIVQETREWETIQNEQGQEQPRRAGVSSFGIGGVNAHVVIEEYVPNTARSSVETPYITSQNPGIFVLSAKNEVRLKEHARQLADAIGKSYKDEDLINIAYTLQAGRDAMEERLAIIAGSVQELEEKLKEFAEGQSNIEDLYRGKIDKGTLQTLTADEEIQEVIEKWMERGKFAKLLELWVKGLDVDWTKLYADDQPKRISLPTYPFAKDRYWISGNSEKNGTLDSNKRASHSVTSAVLHPLMHQNTSNLMEQRFSSIYTGEEFFLADHVVKGQRILPGVAHLEMARAAIEQAAELQEGQNSIKLKNAVWVRPIVVEDQPLKVHIRLSPEDHGEISYEIYSNPEAPDEKPVVYSQGSAVLNSDADVPVIDLRSLQAQCNQSQFTVNEVYDTYRMIGFDYGPAFRGVERVYTGENLVLARLSLHPAVLDTVNQYAMHPGLMDSALQASSILTGAGDNRLMLPFAVQELEVFGACSSVMWAYARYSKDSKATDKVQKRDIDICDDDGNVCVRMKGLSFRAAEGEADAAGNTQTMETLMLEPGWIHQDAGKDGDPEYERHIVMVCEMNGISKESIETRIKGAECIVLKSVHEGLAERFQDYAEQAFETIQSILKSKPKGHVLIQTLAAAQSKQQLFSGLTGLLKTAGLENSKLKGQMIEIEPNEEIESIAEKVKENKRNAEDRHIKYEKGKRYIADLSEVNESDREITMPWKDNGVYLITGGAGGLGFIFAKEIVSQVNQPVLILTGRSELSADKHSQLKELQRLGARAEYRQIDVTQRLAVADLITSITADYGDLNGIIHSAGLIKDNYLITKNKEELQQVLAPKVKGLVNVDEASEHLALDFFILFSSISGVVGSAGQADYAMANAFMDSYAAYRNALVTSMYRHGQTLSINWPLWKEGGMQVDEVTEKLTLKNTGVTAMRTETGIQALYKGLAYGTNNVIVMEGIRDIMKDKLFQKTPSAAAPKETVQEPVDPAAAIEDGALSNQIEEVLKQEISQLLKIKPEEIDADVEFNQYGFDSITLTEFANKLNDEYKLDLTPTIFFEYATVNTFAAFLSEEYLDKFTAQFAADVKVEKPVQSVAKNIEGNRLSHKQRFAKQTVPPVQTVADQAPEPIAIVGMSGVFPKAEDVEEYWANLKEGVDCITEVPKDRWDWREYYGDPLKEANKTNVKWGGFIDGVADFDPLFFGISPLEAEQMEPQQRLLMTYAWKAIEEAGYSAQSLSGSKTGIFIGTGNTGYSSLLSNVEIEGSTAANMSPSAGPNRVSYLLNIHGPSEPIDTACSSSLVAIHHAVCAIEAGNCEMAIAGGVNTVVTPQGHIAYDKAGALSKEGRCKTFSDKADGFAVSEGAGILFLKKLKAAEQAGDHIYGVIKGSAVNHGGRANSLTTPNPKAQAEVVKTAYTKAGIDPRTVTYIEAHGTGTELGDPVEINGLKAAFKALYEKTGDPSVQTSHCGLGSAKTNIGHLSLAAGVAGVIKILLQLKHKTLVKSLYSESVNPYIKLEDSPFYILQESREWKALKDAAGRELPRRAGVSSFGIGGVNAHVVIEEYIPKETSPAAEAPTVSSQNPGIFVLSAKEEERLKEQAQQLSEAISKQSFTNSDLIDVAYTLQAGRDEMEERLGIIAVSVQDLQEKLKKFITGQTNAEGLYRGRVDKGALQTLMASEETQKAMKNGWEHRTYAKLLELWVKGMKMDWNSLYGEDQPNRLSLPTYPFAKERYWITDVNEEAQTHQISVKSAGAAVIHPLLQENISDLSEQRFSSVFTGQEYFFKDHIVQGSPVMPGVTYLEMVHAAVTQAVRGLKDKQSVIQMKNVVWVQPIVSDGQPVQVDISLDPHQDGEIAFEIYTDGEKNERHIHSQGSAVICGAQKMPKLDIGTLQAQCNQNTISAEQCYELFKAIGIDYGPGLQGIKNLYIGRNQALAELSLPSSVSGTTDQFVLHPSMADSALQASIGLKLNSGDDQLSLPFALQELEVFSKCTDRMWASVTSHTNEERIQRLDIDLCDEQGQVCVRIKGISSRVLEENGQSPRDRKTPEVTESLNGALLMAPLWDQVHVEKSRAVSSASERVVIIGGDEKSRKAVQSQYPHVQSLTIDQNDRIDEIEYKLKACGAFDHIVWIASSRSAGKKADNEMIEAQNQGVIKIYRVIKAMLALGCGDRDIKWTVVTENTQFVDQHDIVDPVHAGIHGLIGSMAKEYTNWQTTLIDLGAPDDWSAPEIWSLPDDRDGNTWACRNKIWHKQRLVPVHKTQSFQSKYKHGGVYVVIGGAGGIGEAWSEYIIKTYQAHVVWIGRRKKDEAIQAKLDKLADLGPAPFYIEADAANQVDLENAYEKIKLMHQEINGIVHSAIVLQDQSLANMTEERFRNVLSAKVDVSVRMAQVFHNEPLDFALFFSSVQSFARASGQSNYAAGCSFKDAFAHWLSQVWPCAVAVMNWSYWGSVGVVSSPDYQQRMAQAGIGSIEAPEAMEALELLLGGPLHQLVLMKMENDAASEAEQLKETIEVYPEEHSSTIQNLRSYHPGDSTKIQQLI